MEGLELRNIFDYDQLKKLFVNYAVTTGYDVALYDLEGNEQLSSGSNALCLCVKNRDECVSGICYGANKAFELGEPYIFFTSCGFVACAIAVVYGGRLIGSIISGPVILWDLEDITPEERERNIQKFDKPAEVVQTTCEKLRSAVSILKVLSDYVTHQAEERSEFRRRMDRTSKQINKAIAEKEDALRSARQLEEARCSAYPFKSEKELITYILLGNRNKAVEIINRFFGEILLFADGNLDVIKVKLYELSAFISRATVEAGVPLTEMMEVIGNASSILNKNAGFTDICQTIVSILNYCIDKIYALQPQKNVSIHLGKAIQYINEHFTEEGLSLSDVAEKVYINSYYLSHLFRKEMHTTFSEYLCTLRVERAKELLRAKGKSVESIASESGFGDYNHFIKTFKKSVGLTPAKYRKIWQN